MMQPIKNNDIGCLVVINDKLPSSSIVINAGVLNKEESIGNQIINVNIRKPLILPQKTPKNKIVLQNKIIPQNKIVPQNKIIPQNKIVPQNKIIPKNKIIPVTKSFNFLQLPKTNRKQFNFL